MWESCVAGAVGELFHSYLDWVHSRKCSTFYSVACSSECVAEVVFVVQSSQTL